MPLLQQSIGIYCPQGPQQKTCSGGFADVGLCRDRQTDRRADTVPFHRPCCACYARSANSQCKLVTLAHHWWLRSPTDTRARRRSMAGAHLDAAVGSIASGGAGGAVSGRGRTSERFAVCAGERAVTYGSTMTHAMRDRAAFDVR